MTGSLTVDHSELQNRGFQNPELQNLELQKPELQKPELQKPGPNAIRQDWSNWRVYTAGIGMAR